MRLLYLCAVDPPPPQSDGSAVRSFFETLPEYLYPASSDRDSPHKLFFADRVGRSIIMEFFDFAVVFLSKNFLNSENAMACLARAKTAFPNMVCVDLHNNLTAEETSIAARYSKHILSLDEGRQFLISTFPEIAAAYDLQTKELTKSIETDGYEYLDDTISDLKKQKKCNYGISWVCYGLSDDCVMRRDCSPIYSSCFNFAVPFSLRKIVYGGKSQECKPCACNRVRKAVSQVIQRKI